MSNMISVASGFQYSVNIGYDLGNADKLKNFIPTRSALELLEDILLSTDSKSTDRARVLIGAYGKGKSHIVLTILSLLLKKDISLFEKMMPKVSENPRLAQLVQNYYDSGNKILPVVITGSNTSLTQAFLISLQRTLDNYGLLGAMPETNYQAAVSVINRWEKDFPETYRQFKKMIDEPAKRFVERLQNYDVAAYETFEKAYPELTAGSVFNPFLGFDVIELYESVAKSLQAEGYTGIYVVYDEFSKFLEANIVSASLSDTKMLQDFAEKCNRSGELQLHIMLISHKEISNYIDKLPKQKVDGWRGVSDRFKHIRLSNNFAQTYEIISTVIQHHEPEWGQFCALHRNDFEVLCSRYRKHQMFHDGGTDLETTITGCYPLHPVSTFILPRLSEKVAQNERTLFTFLSAKGTATLSSFLGKYADDEFRLITPDRIYDYFEPLFKKEAYAGDIHNTYLLTSTILNQLQEGSLGCKIVKTISLIYILEQFERLNPTMEQIVAIYSGSYEVEEIEKAITDLKEKELVVYVKRSNAYLRLKKTSGVDIWQKIHDLIESQSSRVSPKDVLNASNFDNYMYPSRYNDEHEMTRFFAFQFIDSTEAINNVDWRVKSETVDADGIIYGVIPDNEEELSEIIDSLSISSIGDEQVIFSVPKHYMAVKETIQEYSAVAQLREQTIDDPVLFEEYEVVFEDLQEVVKEYVGRFTHPERYAAIYIHNGNIVDIHRKSALTELMSKICDSVFSMTPVINNEAVNKNEITSTAYKSRSKIIGALLRSEMEPNLGLVGTGQEVSIMRSTLIRTGIWTETDGVPSINLRPKDARIRNMLMTIEGCILAARQTGSISFRAIYELLTEPKQHIGLRQGLIPIYLAVALHKYRQQVVICDRFGPVAMSTDVLMQINSEPDKYTLEYLEWDREKERFVKQLAEAFCDYVVEAEKNSNSYEYAANAMRRWFMALPKYAKETKKDPSGEAIAREQIGFLKLLRQNTGGSDLLFKKLPELFGAGEFSADIATEVIKLKHAIERRLEKLKDYLVAETRTRLLPSGTEDAARFSLASAIHEWCDALDPRVFEQLFSDGTERFLELLRNATNDEYMLVSKLGKLATGLRLEDWDERTASLYFEAIDRYISSAREFHSNVVAQTINDTYSYQMSFVGEDGQSTTRRFERVEVSPRGKLLFNQINFSLEAMGHAISDQEKRQILMEILKKLC